MMRQCWANGLPLLILLVAPNPTNAFDVIGTNSSIRTIAFRGDEAPGTGGQHFHQFGIPKVNGLGAVSFIATLSECCSSGDTVHSTGTGTLELVAWRNFPAQHGAANTFREFRNIQIDNLGRTMIRSEMNSLPPEFDGVYVGKVHEMLTTIAVSGQPVDPLEPQTTYHILDTPQLGAGGMLAGRAVTITDGKVFPGSDVLFKSTGNELAVPVLRVGDQLDFLPPGVEIGSVLHSPFNNPVVNARGQIAVRVDTIDTREQSSGRRGRRHVLLIEPDNSYVSVVSQGNAITSGGVFGAPTLPVLNNRGQVAFGAYTDSILGLWRKSPGEEPELVVHKRSDVPGMPGVIFDDLFVNFDSEMPIWITDNGDVAFWASLVGAPLGNDFAESVWIGSPGNLIPILIERQEAPDTGGGVFASMTSTIGDLVHSMAVNNRSQVAVHASYEVIPGQRRFGLFATDSRGELQKLVVPGDFLEVSPGDIREVRDISFAGDHQKKRGTGLNDRGEVVFGAFFTDGSSGVFMSSAVAVPEPPSLTMLLSFLPLVVTVRWIACSVA